MVVAVAAGGDVQLSDRVAFSLVALLLLLELLALFLLLKLDNKLFFWLKPLQCGRVAVFIALFLNMAPEEKNDLVVRVASLSM